MIIPLTNNRIASCSDKIIKIWNSNHPYNLIKILKNYPDNYTSIIQLKGKEFLISGCENLDGLDSLFGRKEDNALRKWNLLTYQCDTNYFNVSCSLSNSILQIDNNRIIVGGSNVITIVNISINIIEQQIIDENLNFVYSLIQLRDGNVICGFLNGEICLYDINLNTFSYKDEPIHDNSVSYLLNINKHTFISCSFDKTIKVWEY